MEKQEEQEERIEEFVSQLGNKEYWDKFYSEEINQFNDNDKLIGEIWFGKQVLKKGIDYICNKLKNYEKDVKVLDVGCGNGAFMIGLAKMKYNNLWGMDYSENSLTLAQNIVNKKSEKYENLKESIKLYQEDINHPDKDIRDFEIIYDKGSLDAYLSKKEHNVSKYIDFLLTKSKNRAIFIINSCNYTKEELLEYFDSTKFFHYLEEIPHKSFNFGGQKGQPVTTLVFRINF